VWIYWTIILCTIEREVYDSGAQLVARYSTIFYVCTLIIINLWEFFEWFRTSTLAHLVCMWVHRFFSCYVSIIYVVKYIRFSKLIFFLCGCLFGYFNPWNNFREYYFFCDCEDDILCFCVCIQYTWHFGFTFTCIAYDAKQVWTSCACGVCI